MQYETKSLREARIRGRVGRMIGSVTRSVFSEDDIEYLTGEGLRIEFQCTTGSPKRGSAPYSSHASGAKR